MTVVTRIPNANQTEDNDDRLAREAEAAQRTCNWRRAAAIWREAAEATEDANQSEWFAKQAAWCDDMAVLVNETDDQP